MWLSVAGVTVGCLLVLLILASWQRERRGLAGYVRASAFRKPSVCTAIANSLVVVSIYEKQVTYLADLTTFGECWMRVYGTWARYYGAFPLARCGAERAFGAVWRAR
ncbi:MAG: hypothetical protein RMM08_09775, partial [Armatimonadota bacterium]|nr:hypothetical protein [Armatimonadota bacterium]